MDKKTNNKTIKNKFNISENTLKILNSTIFILLFVFILYPPYLRGMYFEDERFVLQALIFLLFAVFWIYKYIKRDKGFLKTPLDYASLFLLVVYFIPIVLYIIGIRIAVSPRLAVSEWLKYSMYLAVFFMISELANTHKRKTMFLWGIVMSTVGLCIIGIDGALGNKLTDLLNTIFDNIGLNVKFFDTFVNGRIYSTLQYPNAFAAYLMAVFFIVISLMISSKKHLTTIIGGISAILILITFFYTQSRGAQIMFPLILLIYIIVLPIQKKSKKIFIITSISFVAIGLGLFAIISNVSTPLELAHGTKQKDGQISRVREISLTPLKTYKLTFDALAYMDLEKPFAYSVRITNKTIGNIVEAQGGVQIGYIQEKATKGTEHKEITFKVPENSKVVSIAFSNKFAGTKVIFDNAKIIDSESEKVVKNIVLNFKYLPESFASRFLNMFSTKSYLERITYYKDAFKIAKDRWLLGGGGGAWTVLNFHYQSYLYWSTQPHAYVLQLLVEAGALGILTFVFLIISLLTMLFSEKFIEKSPNEEDSQHNMDKIIQAGLFAAISALILHSFIDFDLSLSAVSLLLWELIALFNVRYRNAEKILIFNNIKKINMYPLIGVGLAIVLMFISINLKSAMIYANNAINKSKSDITAAVYDMKNAMKKDPFKEEYKLDYINLSILQLKQKTPDNVSDFSKDMLDIIEKSEKLGYYNADSMGKVGKYYLNLGNADKGLQAFRRATELRPLRQEEWQQEAIAYYSVVDYYVSQNDKKNAVLYIDKAMELIDRAKVVNKKRMNGFKFNKATLELLDKMKKIKEDILKNKGLD